MHIEGEIIMAQTLSALNDKLNKQIVKEKSKLISKDLLGQILMALVFSPLAFSINFGLGACFCIPLLCFLIERDKRQGLFTMLIITLLTLFIDYVQVLNLIIAFVPLLFFVHRENNDKINYLILNLLGLISYTLNSILKQTDINFMQLIFICLFISAFYTIYLKSLEINHTKKQFLFKEDVYALIVFLFNLQIGLFTIKLYGFNLGLLSMSLTIMFLGMTTTALNTLITTFLVYFALVFSGYPIQGNTIIPYLGVFSAFLPKENFSLKTFCFFLGPVVIYYLGYLTGDLLGFFLSNALVTTVYYIVSFFCENHLLNILTPKYEDAKYYQIYVENFREEVSQRLLNFAELFKTFAYKSLESSAELMKLDDAIEELTERHCKKCLKKELCLNCNHIKTYNYFSQILKEGEEILNADKKRFLDLFSMYCFEAYAVINSAIELNQEYLLSSKTHNNTNLLFQSQLQGLAQILQEYAIEVHNDYESDTIKIERLRDKLRKAGVNIIYVKANCIKPKNLDIDLGIRNYEGHHDNLILNFLNDLFKEEVDISVLKTNKNLTKLKVTSKQVFELEFGTSYIGKDGSRISGDNFLKCEMHNGNTVIALSDGMGSGYSAHVESKSTLELLNKMLQTGTNDKTAVSILNTLLSLKEYNERYSTLDYATINKSKGTIDFYKIGSAPSFIIRGNKVIRIDNANLPMGHSGEIEKVTCELMVNDIIVMVSDGVIERYNNINKFEKTLVQILRTSSIQIAHDIIRAAITEFGGKIPDDMTAIVIKVNPCKNKLSA